MIDFEPQIFNYSNVINQSFGHFQNGSNLRIIDERYKALLYVSFR